MKNSIKAVAAIILAAFAACATPPPPTADQMIQSALGSVPAGVLVAAASARNAATADSEAEVLLIMAMTSIAGNMIAEAATAGEIDTKAVPALVRSVAAALTISPLDGAVRHGSGVSRDNVYWTVIYMEKSGVIQDISGAVATARQTVPNTEGFSIASRFDAEFEKATAEEWRN
jgi:hypothetical protein